MLSADNFCKQFGPRSGLIKCQAGSGSKLFDTLMVFLKEFLEKVDFEKKSADGKKNLAKITQKAKSYTVSNDKCFKNDMHILFVMLVCHAKFFSLLVTNTFQAMLG